jgi:colanic acid/amylovoran biosynthesis glycosyltransferase
VPRLRPDADANRFRAWSEDILRRREARLVHAYFGPVGWRMLELKRKLGLPLVVTFLGDEIAPAVAPWWSWWIQSDSKPPDWPARLKELLAGADLLLAEGPFIRDRIVELGCPPEKVHVQRMGLPLTDIPFRPRLPPANGKTVIVFAGRFCEQKGVLYALQAFHELRREGRDVELRLIGNETMTDGTYAARIYAYIRDHGLQDSVRLLGFLNHAECMEELQSGDLFLHPSVVDAVGRSEGGAPTAIIEAQALGMPVVSTTHCDIPNVTVPGQSALLVPERDTAALADALRTLVDDPGRWEAMGHAGRRHVEEHHEIDKLARGLEDTYFSLLASS